MNQINDLPPEYNFGQDFDYSVWTAGTELLLCNVPWSNDYRDIVRFSSNSALDAYLNTNSGPRIHIDSVRYTPPGYPVRISVPFNQALKYNYLRVANPAQPIGGDVARVFYYFIVDVRYISPGTTEIMVQLDVWQTYNRDVTFGNCYIERGHIGIANQNNFNKYGREYLTVPEGLDLGNEYELGQVNSYPLINSRDDVATGVIVTSTTKLTGPYGTLDNPVLETAEGSDFEGLPNGCSIYYFASIAAFKHFAKYMADKPWITQGIVSIMPIPFVNGSNISSWYVFDIENTGVPLTQRRVGTLSGTTSTESITLSGNWRDGVLPARYSHLKKFLTFPYTFVELTTFSGTPIVLKPELLPYSNIRLTVHSHYAPPGPRIMVTADGYNASSNVADPATLNDYDSDYLDTATGVTNLPTFSVPNNSYLSYMASNANSIAYQHASADWSQQRALTGAALAADQATANIDLASTLTNQGVNAANSQTALANQTAGYRAAVNAASGLIGGIGGGPAGLAGGAMGAAMSGVNYAIDRNQNNQSTAISNALAMQQTASRNSTGAYMRDTNQSYANFAARGDYANTIAGINAKVQDARMIPPTSVGQVGGDAFNLAIDRIAVYARIKRLTPAAMATIGEFWLRYGYSVNRFGNIPSDYQVMTKFTYWKLTETYIKSNTCPELFRQTIRGIFEKGVTVWANPNDIGTIDVADNAPKPGITL